MARGGGSGDSASGRASAQCVAPGTPDRASAFLQEDCAFARPVSTPNSWLRSHVLSGAAPSSASAHCSLHPTGVLRGLWRGCRSLAFLIGKAGRSRASRQESLFSNHLPGNTTFQKCWTRGVTSSSSHPHLHPILIFIPSFGPLRLDHLGVLALRLAAPFSAPCPSLLWPHWPLYTKLPSL